MAKQYIESDFRAKVYKHPKHSYINKHAGIPENVQEFLKEHINMFCILLPGDKHHSTVGSWCLMYNEASILEFLLDNGEIINLVEKDIKLIVSKCDVKIIECLDKNNFIPQDKDTENTWIYYLLDHRRVDI